MERLHALDSEFLEIEDGVDHMHIGLCAVFEGPCPSEREARVWVASRLPDLPRHRQRVRPAPLGLTRPGWEDATDFDVADHVLHTTLCAPGGDRELEELMAEVMATELDRRRPLWELWVVDGLDGGRWALIAKVHHCLVDGVAGMVLFEVLLDVEPHVTVLPVDDDWVPEPPSSDTRLLGAGVVDLVRPLAGLPRWLAARAVDPVGTFRAVRTLASGAAGWLGLVWPAPPTSIDGIVGPERTWRLARVSLEDAKAIRRERGGTVNDVVLTAVTAGFRDLLLARGEDTRQVRLRTAVPVSVRHDETAVDNEVSSIWVELPVAVRSPELRYELVRTETERAKHAHEAEAGEALAAAADWLPAPLLAAGTRAAAALLHRYPQRNIGTVTTNVPGPPVPLYGAGRRLLELFPYVGVALGVRVTVAVTSYEGVLSFGVTGDAASTPDLDVLARGIERAVEELR